MKITLFSLCMLGLGMLLSEASRAQSYGIGEGLVISSTSPFLFSGSVSSEISPSTSHKIEFKASADVEQYKDEFPMLHEDMKAGLIKSIADIRQPALRELFIEISSSEEQMKEIDALMANGTKVQKIAVVLSQILFK
jgi:hypothetical protein